MSDSIIALVLLLAIMMLLFIFVALKRGRMPIKYALVWLMPTLVILFLAIFPFVLEWFATIIGFATLSNLVIGILLALLLFISMALTIIIAGQSTKITLLIQEVSLLKEKVKTMTDK